VQYLFKLKNLLEEHIGEIARLITLENGKTLAEAKAEIRRGIENVEVACGIPMMMQGYNLEDVTPGVDETLIRQPLGVVAAITPFNFPAMIPFWFLPYAIACGNTLVLKPSERVPLTMRRVIELIEKTGLPRGVVNLVNGGRVVVDALCDHPQVRAISFVGSTPVAKHVYARAAASGKRMQCQGGAKNHVIVLPDADMDLAKQIISDSAFGCAGQRWSSLTDGERTLVALAHALVREPRLLVADDPTANLDVLQREEVTSLLRHAADEQGLGVLITVPDMPEASYADRVASLSDGRLLISRDPASDAPNVIDFPGAQRSA